MAVSAFSASPRRASSAEPHRDLRAAPRAIALAPSRRPMLNAAAQEKLAEDLRFSALVAAFACCAGIGLALGLHWDDALSSLRLALFSAEEPRWLLHIVDRL